MTWTPPEVAKTAQSNGWVPPEVEKKSTTIQEPTPDTDVTSKLNPQKESEFQNWWNTNPAVVSWKKDFKSQYGEEPQQGGDYDYRGAFEAGITPSPSPDDNNHYHWDSIGKDGKDLKSENHPTRWKSEYMKSTGENPDEKGISFDDAVKKVPAIEKYRPPIDKEKEAILAGITSPEERTIVSTALDRTNEYFKNLGGKTPYQKMQEFDSRLEELNKKYDPKSFAGMTDESLSKIEDQYKKDARALAVEVGLDIDRSGQITAPINEREMFSRKMGEYMSIAENESRKANEPGFFENLASSLASGYHRASGAALDLLGTVSGLNYFDSYKDLAEGNRYNADVFKQQASKYDQTIEEYAKQGDLGKATGQAITSAVESLPYMIPAMVNPEYGVYVMGGMSGIDKYRDLESKNIPQWEKVYNSLSTGAFEAIFEKVGTGAILARSKRAILEMGEKKGREAITNAVTKTVENSASKIGPMPEWVKEGLSEVATGIGQNLTDKVTFNPDQNIGEGALDNFVVGAIMGKAFALPQDIAKLAERQQVKEFATKVLDKLPADMDVETKINLGWKIAERDKLQEAEDKLDPKFKGKYATQLVTLNSEIDKAAEDYLSKAKVEEVPELSVGKMDEVGDEQAKLDYLQEKGVKVPDGATMDELNELYDTEKAKTESTDTSKKEQVDNKLPENSVSELSKEPVVKHSDKLIPDTDFNGQRIMTAEEWNALPKEEQRKLDKTITEEVTDNKGNSFSVDKGLAPFLRRIFKLGINTGQSDSGMVGDHPNYRYVEDDKNGEFAKGDIIGKGSGAYLSFWKPEAKQIEEAGRDINSQEQIDNIRKAADNAGFEVLDTQVFFNPSLRIAFPYTTDGTGRQAILKEANDKTNEKYPGLYDTDFMEWLDYRNHIFEPEVVKAHGGRIEYTDKMVNDKWNEFVSNLEQLSSTENISPETQTEVPKIENIPETEIEKVSDIQIQKSESHPTAIQETEKSLQKEKPLTENEKLNLQKDEAQQERLQASEEITPEKTQKIKEAATKAADTLRKAKFVQSMDDLSKLSSDPTAILKVAWDGSVEAAAKTIELGGSVAQAVADGVKTLKESDWYKKLSDESKKIAEERFANDIETHFKTEGYAETNGTGTPTGSQEETPVQGEDGGVRVRNDVQARLEKAFNSEKELRREIDKDYMGLLKNLRDLKLIELDCG